MSEQDLERDMANINLSSKDISSQRVFSKPQPRQFTNICPFEIVVELEESFKI